MKIKNWKIEIEIPDELILLIAPMIFMGIIGILVLLNKL
jgi:hypothetical protein